MSQNGQAHVKNLAARTWGLYNYSKFHSPQMEIEKKAFARE